MVYEMLTPNDLNVLHNMAHRLHEFRAQNVARALASSNLGAGPDFTHNDNGMGYNFFSEVSPEIHMQWSANEIKQALGKRTLRTVFMQAVANHLNTYGWITATVFANPQDDGQFAYDQRYIQISTKPFQQVEVQRMTFNQVMNNPLPNFGD